MTPRRVLFYKPSLSWPFASGHDVHTTQMCRAMSDHGQATCFVTDVAVPDGARPHIRAAAYATLDAARAPEASSVRLTRLQERFRAYWGVSTQAIARLGGVACDFQADAVVVSGLGVLPMLGAVPPGTRRVWYAADEWVMHHLSMMSARQPSTWAEIKTAAVKGLYERSYRSLVDRVWVVTEPDARAMRLFMGARAVDVLPNGVDAAFYTPSSAAVRPFSAVFWGRLDFGPNVQAIDWFVREVWPRVRRDAPDATLTIMGFHPGPAISALAGRDGIDVRADVQDIRPTVAESAVVIMPFVSGAGIKNKFLEAAAMGKPIVASRIARLGLRGEPAATFVDSPEQWRASMLHLWRTPGAAGALGAAARAWVVTEHTWESVAAQALQRL